MGFSVSSSHMTVFDGFANTSVYPLLEAVSRRSSTKKVFLQILLNSFAKYMCQSLFGNKIAGFRLFL